MRLRDASTEEYLPICDIDGLSGIAEPSDADINFAYNVFDAEKMKYFHDVFVSLKRDFTKRKNSKPSEWRDFANVVKMCRINKFNLKCYIKYCFLNRLVPKSKGRTLSDISFLRNTPQIMDYARNREKIERLYAIYVSIQKTIIVVRGICKKTGCTAKESIKKLLSSQQLSTYISTGTVSPYFIALIPKASVIIHNKIDRQCEDGTVLIDFCNRIAKYGKSAIESLSMFYPNSMTKTIVEMCS